MSGQPRLRVAICGGGIAGLTLAVVLSAYTDIQVDIYEAASHYGEAGAGVGMWWRSRCVLAAMGLEADLTDIIAAYTLVTVVPSINYCKSDQQQGQHFATLVSRGGLATLYRPEFQTILLRRLSNRVYKYTFKRLASYSQHHSSTRDPIRLVFADGTQAVCDVLVGADGIKSAARAGMMQEMAANAKRQGHAAEAAALRDCIHPCFGGAVVYRVVVPAEKLAAVAPHHRALSAPYQYLGRNKHVMAYPISRGKLINNAIFNTNYAQEGTAHPEPWVTQADPREILCLFDGWSPELQQLVSASLACAGGVAGRVVLVGDAASTCLLHAVNVSYVIMKAHACTPFQGAGAVNAIEDAYVLAQLLGHRHCTRDTMHRVLQLCSGVRRPVTQRVAELSRRSGFLFALHGAPSSLPELAHNLQKCFDEAQEGDPFQDVRRAMEKLESSR